MTGLFIFAILYVLEPFGISQISETEKRGYALTYGGIAFGVAFLFTVIFPVLFKSAYEEKSWTVLKEILNVLLLLVTISWVNLVTHHYVEDMQFTVRTYLESMVYTLIMGLFPVAFAMLIKQRTLQKKNYLESKRWQELLEHHPTNGREFLPNESTETPVANGVEISSKIVLTGVGIGEVIELDEDNFLYISSADNYANVYFLANETVKRVLIRNTLKNLEEKLSPYSMIVRCHRGYIINLRKVARVAGDAQGLKISIEGVDEEILVGKTYLGRVKGLLEQVPV